MIASVAVLATLASAAIAAPTYYNTYDSNQSFPTCRNYGSRYVEKPAWGGDGKPYGYENGQSCIAKDGDYGTGSYSHDSYSKPSYDRYSKPSYDTYSQPSHDSYVTPSYDSSSHDSYSKPTYGKYGSLVATGYQAPSTVYSAPSEGYSAPPAIYGPSSGYSAPTYGSSYSCESDFPHFHSTSSPTLIQCAKIACADGQPPEYVQRALYQCHALETQAKATGYMERSCADKIERPTVTIAVSLDNGGLDPRLQLPDAALRKALELKREWAAETNGGGTLKDALEVQGREAEGVADGCLDDKAVDEIVQTLAKNTADSMTVGTRRAKCVELPYDVLVHLFAKTSIKELFAASFVCRRWSEPALVHLLSRLNLTDREGTRSFALAALARKHRLAPQRATPHLAREASWIAPRLARNPWIRLDP
ncbi:hypothetical protein BDK51DRAFT_31091 [Blyttiomyces helicus]|uniref:F-box domain-containing protein n=1 Tax=Blyttiomyces helicus TaxID=388810 RepID=A0A4P9W013_9FUNG|nr:hypothetical protein BDK51DRAFT_31091 [Blyttiomyces helicus]|eukprot:RKO85451.1 hypothetical protein BDK51DRAFT_31091 [Blyttiomyces helicus]